MPTETGGRTRDEDLKFEIADLRLQRTELEGLLAPAAMREKLEGLTRSVVTERKTITLGNTEKRRETKSRIKTEEKDEVANQQLILDTVRGQIGSLSERIGLAERLLQEQQVAVAVQQINALARNTEILDQAVYLQEAQAILERAPANQAVTEALDKGREVVQQHKKDRAIEQAMLTLENTARQGNLAEILQAYLPKGMEALIKNLPEVVAKFGKEAAKYMEKAGRGKNMLRVGLFLGNIGKLIANTLLGGKFAYNKVLNQMDKRMQLAQQANQYAAVTDNLAVNRMVIEGSRSYVLDQLRQQGITLRSSDLNQFEDRFKGIARAIRQKSNNASSPNGVGGVSNPNNYPTMEELTRINAGSDSLASDLFTRVLVGTTTKIS